LRPSPPFSRSWNPFTPNVPPAPVSFLVISSLFWPVVSRIFGASAKTTAFCASIPRKDYPVCEPFLFTRAFWPRSSLVVTDPPFPSPQQSSFNLLSRNPPPPHLFPAIRYGASVWAIFFFSRGCCHKIFLWSFRSFDPSSSSAGGRGLLRQIHGSATSPAAELRFPPGVLQRWTQIACECFLLHVSEDVSTSRTPPPDPPRETHKPAPHGILGAVEDESFSLSRRLIAASCRRTCRYGTVAVPTLWFGGPPWFFFFFLFIRSK